MTSPVLTFRVPDMTCEHCRVAVREKVGKVRGVMDVEVDLTTRLVHVVGVSLDVAAVADAIDEAGYDAKPV